MIETLQRTVFACTVIAACGMVVLRCLPLPDYCTPLATRCYGSMAQICDEETRWGAYLDCDEVAKQSGGVWVCCPSNADAGNKEATCVQAQACPGGAK